MLAESTAAEGTHNHPVRCCCRGMNERDPDWETCPACPEHGDQAECPSCHTPYGRPHTDYCQAVAPAEYPGQPDHCAYPRSDHGDGRGCDDDNCPKHGGDGRTTWHHRSECPDLGGCEYHAITSAL